MANDNNKINKLVSSSDDDPTAELEIPASFPDEREQDAQELEADASTFEFEQSQIDRELDGQSIATLKSGLKSRTERINRLQFDIEQLRAKWTGLEKEIEARAEITNNLNAEIDQLNGKLQSSEQDLDKRQQDLVRLENDLNQATQDAKKSAAETEQIRQAAKKDQARIRELEKQLASREKKIASIDKKLGESLSNQRQDDENSVSHDRRLVELEQHLAGSRTALSDLRHYVDGRKESWTQREVELAQAKTKLEKAECEVGKLSLSVDDRAAQLSRSQSEIEKLSGQLATQVADCKKLKADNRKIRQILRNDAAKEIERNRRLIAEQSGLLTASEHEIRELKAQVDRTERYADDLRQQLQEQSEISETAVNKRQGLQTALTAAQHKIGELSESLESTQRQHAELTDKLSGLEKNFAEEVRQIRFELGAAQETIADQDTVNEQLASDLFENKDFRQALETQLSETEEQYDEKIRQLQQKANRLRNQADDYERKLKNKDNAIAALMNELASRSQTIESIGEIENVIHEIDDRMSERFDEQSHSDRGRVTRLLIGKTDGQELRFPLFKDRLTIGRTAHNDIQLKAQYISRRHAVIVTENGGTRIVDWGSKNGVFINEKRVAEQVLKNGDVVTIGTTDFRYEERPKR